MGCITLRGWWTFPVVGTTCICTDGVCWYSLLYSHPSKVRLLSPTGRHLLRTFISFIVLVSQVFQSSSFPLAGFLVSSDSHLFQNAGISLLLRFSVEEEKEVCAGVSFCSPWISFLLCVFFGTLNEVWLVPNFCGIVMWISETDHELSHIQHQENTIFL